MNYAMAIRGQWKENGHQPRATDKWNNSCHFSASFSIEKCNIIRQLFGFEIWKANMKGYKKKKVNIPYTLRLPNILKISIFSLEKKEVYHLLQM